ncbi:Bud site selection protein 6 [Golovinomyces cichoracearum]|uniref:Bud site selection protein 6 n=1 Tax=Golovinomyces cichoracearum TaxID=62708 RepID=A0A420IUV4_9PEZI|nr:Bud site selection protein 6 [Golovinomyces cichoracearum]
MQSQSNSLKNAHRKSPGPPSSASIRVNSEEVVSQVRASGSSTKSNSTGRRVHPQQIIPNPPPLSQIEKSVTHLLVATKQLLETLTQWSRQQATDAQVSDVYVRLGYEFNIACRAFTAINVETSDLGNVPELLRTILESTLSQEASVESLERYLPRIRDIIINLLHGLKRKQQKLRQKQVRDQNADQPAPRNISSGTGSTGLTSLLDQGMPDNTQRNNDRPTATPNIAISQRGSSYSGRRGATRGQLKPFAPLEEGVESNGTHKISINISSHPEFDSASRTQKDLPEDIDSFPPPPPPPKVSTNALAALQRGGDLERRASRRYSTYQITKHLNASPNGVPMLPQNSPVPNKGLNDNWESMRAIQSRGAPRNVVQQPSQPSTPASQTTSSKRINESDKDRPVIAPHSVEREISTAAIPGPENKIQHSPKNNRQRNSTTDVPSASSDLLPAPNLASKEKEPHIQETVQSPQNDLAVESQKLPVSKNSGQYMISTSPPPARDLTLFLQYKTKVKKFVLPGGFNDLSIARLQLAFIEKFAWNTHHNGVDLPEIYIQDPVVGVRHELEDLNDVKDGSVLVLNIEALDEVKRHIDDGLSGIKKIVEGIRTAVDDQQTTILRVSDRQQETAKELCRIQTIIPQNSRESINDSLSNNTTRSSKKISNFTEQRELQAVRRDLAILRQIYSAFQTDVQNSMNTLRKTAENVKAVAAKTSMPNVNSDSGRAYVNEGKKTLDEDSDKLVGRVDDLQDMVEDLRKDVVLRGVRPLPRQLEDVSRDISQAGKELMKLQEFLKRERPIWTKIWEKELERVCKDREDLTLIEDLIVDLEDDLTKASQTFTLVEEATKEQLKESPGATSVGRALSRGLSQIIATDSTSAKEGVLDEVRALQPNHENRIEAIERAEKLRIKELESRREGEFEKELGSFVEEGKLRKSGGFEETERIRKIRDEKIRMEVWERQNLTVQPEVVSDTEENDKKDHDSAKEQQEVADEG